VRVSLELHPDSRCDAVTGIDVELFRPRPGALALRYTVVGTIPEVAIPPAVEPERADGLWRHSCFEAFIQTVGPGYWEFNFSPSSRWAAYTFSSYREGMAEAGVSPPRIETHEAADSYQLRAELDGLPTETLQIGLSAVIEERNGRKSYWALAHPHGKADFHHPDCFTLQLPAAYTP
jgi:hypothetical protein